MTNERQCGRALQVMVVDDNKEFVELFAMELRTCGYEVQVAGDGQTALQIALAEPPDVILTDLGLPGMHGYKLAKLLRAQLGPKKPVFIALTGYSNDSDQLRSKAEGFQFHFTKPVQPSLLRDLLASLAKSSMCAD
jgi:CheY-like chemotaxis protein